MRGTRLSILMRAATERLPRVHWIGPMIHAHLGVYWGRDSPSKLPYTLHYFFLPRQAYVS